MYKFLYENIFLPFVVGVILAVVIVVFWFLLIYIAFFFCLSLCAVAYVRIFRFCFLSLAASFVCLQALRFLFKLQFTNQFFLPRPNQLNFAQKQPQMCTMIKYLYFNKHI